MIRIINRQRKIPVDIQWLHALGQELLNANDISSFDLGILLTTNRTIRQYNEKYRHKQGPTDILSFSTYPHHKAGTPFIVNDIEERSVGDLILSLEYIQSYCQKENISFNHRLMELLIHGFCHLLGYDHETDKDYEIMRAYEEQLRRHLPKSLRR